MNRVLHIYHVSLPHGLLLKYDSYSEFVAIAYNANDAREMHPSGGSGEWLYGDWVKWEQRDQLRVTCIGTAAPDIDVPCVICATFHAG